MRMNHSGDRNQTIFEPILPHLDEDGKYDPECLKNAQYEFAKFNSKRFDFENLNERLIVSPPHSIMQHVYKDEIINYVLDKAFIELPLKVEHIEAIGAVLTKQEFREVFLQMLESDYKSY